MLILLNEKLEHTLGGPTVSDSVGHDTDVRTCIDKPLLTMNTMGPVSFSKLVTEDVGNVPVWVKFYGVPMTAFSKDGLSVIATKLGTNEENSKAAGKGSLNVVPDSSSTTPIVEKIAKLERQILDGKLMCVDDDKKPLYKAGSTGIADSDSKLLKQWRKTKRDDDYDSYDDDLYESHDMSENLHAICDDFDIKVHGWKKN
ncbi:hypothetical protein Tco_0504717 [Tanacetum coccineum]